MPAGRTPPGPKGRPRMRRTGLVLALLGAATATRGAIYRWGDDGGGGPFGERPPAGAERVEVAAGDSGTILHSVDWIPDGDTIHLTDGAKVRLIGINTPEVAHRDDPAEPGGPAARDFLRDVLADKRVRLEIGEEAEDKYGRTLAHVFTADGVNVNRRLLRAGHAHAVVKPPNLSRLEAYFAAERAAREAGRGIWGHPRYGVHPASRAEGLRNSFRRIRGRVTGIDEGRKYLYLDFAADFRAYLLRAERKAFAAAGKAPADLVGGSTVVRGWIHLHDGTPRIRLRHPVQIETAR